LLTGISNDAFFFIYGKKQKKKLYNKNGKKEDIMNNLIRSEKSEIIVRNQQKRNNLWLIIFLILFILLFKIITGIGSSSTNYSTVDTAKYLEKATVHLEGYFEEKDLFFNDERYWCGSGFIFRKDNERIYIMTNKHILGLSDIINADFTTPELEKYSIRVGVYGEKKRYPVKEIFIHESVRYDLAYITVDESLIKSDIKVLNFYTEDYYKGREVYSMGSPNSEEFSFNVHNVSNSTVVKDHPCYKIDGAINSGNSGGPLINQRREVIGMNTWVSANNQGMNYAIKAKFIKNALDNNEFVKVPLGKKKLQNWLNNYGQ
ncbi:MAG: trypsin-like peptidase domain-containing protein, partial [bacterium]